MATSSRQTAIFGANDWKAIYKTFSQADFKSYDFESLRKSFVDYLRINYPETFNDYTESSEYIALLDVIAFMGQSLAFRDDLNTRENFIDTAERRDSVIKLANLISYTPKRNLAGQGYLKISSIQTTEQVKDINGLNLSNLTVLWNDPANINWQEQFNTVLNAALIDNQRVGNPGNSQIILGIKTDEYSVVTPANTSPVIPFSATIDGTVMNFECVSVSSIDRNSVYELAPGPTNKFNIVYRNDKLGYGSINTGFFMYFKQGTLGTYPFTLQEKISNNILDINVQGINNTDTWLYQYNNITGALTQWAQVDSVYSVTNTQSDTNRNLFSVNSRFNDQVSYIFGDGVFSDIPLGNFVSYYRTSNSLTYSIDPSEIQGTTISLTYVSRTGKTETLTMTLELGVPINNAQARETLQNIKTRAPQRYYTQNRMVNGEDYNNFPYTLYSSIVKSKAVNRSSVGVSRNFDLTDPSGKYSSTNDFADDGGIYIVTDDGYTNFTATTSSDVISFLTDSLSEILGGNRTYQYYTGNYTRYPVTSTTMFWNQSSFDSLESSGYLYVTGGAPIAAGPAASDETRYVSAGALIKFNAPSGYYFDQNNRLQQLNGPLDPSQNNYIWTSVMGVIGDGYNNGEGNLNNGKGPVTLSNSIPTGAILAEIIPSFSNSLSNTLIQECVSKVALNQSFSLVYNNSLLSNQERWSTSTFSDSDYFVKFESKGSNVYQVTYKSFAYYFGSVLDVRFIFDANKVVYDPLSGKLMQDNVTVLKTNSLPGSNYPFAKDIKLNVTGQLIESDGYTDDYSIEVSNVSLNSAGTFKDPDYFNYITGYTFGSFNRNNFVFFEQLVDANLLSRYVMVPSNSIVYLYGSLEEIATIKYEYPIGQVYYAWQTGKFYKSSSDTTVQNIVNLSEVTNFSMSTGRQGLFFQYKHISDKTTRIDPGTSNIIDLYLVTQSYYTQYQNWINDTTGKVAKPLAPTMSELVQEYSKVNDYKMLSDSVILNSVRFKPLFGNKADPKLQSTIKVIKSSGTTASDSEIRSAVLTEMNNYFSIDNWNFGDTFFFTELSAYIHSALGDLVSSVVLVPNDPTMKFGDLYEIRCAPYEIFVNAAQATDVIVISALTPAELQVS